MIELKPRYFVLPAIAIAVLAMLHPAASGRVAPQDTCAVHARDPGIAKSFARFAASQSHAAAKVCALASNVR